MFAADNVNDVTE